MGNRPDQHCYGGVASVYKIAVPDVDGAISDPVYQCMCSCLSVEGPEKPTAAEAVTAWNRMIAKRPLPVETLIGGAFQNSVHLEIGKVRMARAARALGSKGGKASATNMTAAQRKERAAKAAKARWKKNSKATG